MAETSTLRTLWDVFGKYRKHIAALFCLGVLGAFFEGVGINVAIPLVSFFTGGGAPTDIISRTIASIFGFFHIPFLFRYLLALVLVLFFARAASVALFYFIRSWVTADFLATESKEVFRRLLQASWPYLLRQKIGHTQTLMVRDVQRTATLLDIITQVIQSGTGFVMYCAVALAISPIMTLLALVAAGVLLLSVRPFLRGAVRAGHDMTSTEKSIAQFLSEHIIGMKVVKAGGVAGAALSRAQALIERLRAAQLRMAFVRSVSTSFFQPFSLVFVVILFFVSYRSPSFSILTFAATLYLIQKIFTYAESAQSALHGVSESLAYARHMTAFKRELAAAREEREAGKKPFSFGKELKLRGVSLSYGEREALSGVTVSIGRGEIVGVIGPSGAGKTSFADVLLRLFKPTGGELCLDGVSAADISMDAWRSKVSYVSQEVFLFNESVAENVRFYRDGISDADVVEALKQANVYDVVAALDGGINAHVGDRGVLLSGGQRQRLALARALAGSPELLVLDEATSALDAESEQLIQESIRSLHGKITVVIIAHRLSTVENADTILVFEEGKITEQGSPHELLKNPDSYFSRHRSAKSA